MNGKRKKGIVLWGGKNKGKSKTIKKVYEFFTAEQIKPKDIISILSINDDLIGIESQGDPGGRLEYTLPLFVELGCTIIICAARITRTRTQIFKVVDDLRRKYKYSEMLWLKQDCVSKRLQERNSRLMAQKIVNEVQEIIFNGVL